VTAFAVGKRHTFQVKTLAPVLWKKAGAALPFRVVVIAPVVDRLRERFAKALQAVGVALGPTIRPGK
jgi:hypothetical protein